MQEYKSNSMKRQEQNISNHQQSLERKFKSQIFQKYKQNQNLQHDQEDEPYKKYLLEPANPIINKNKSPDEQVNFKLIDAQRQNIHKKDKNLNPMLRKSKKLDQFIQQPLEIMDLHNGYDRCNLLFRKFQNEELNQMNKKKYFSSIFFPINLRTNGKFELSVEIPTYQGMNKNLSSEYSLIQSFDQQLDFSSNFQSGNLFAIYKTGPYNYDLILQNDINTTGCTQWFYFKVNNKKIKDVIVKFNIVNMYKASSLYKRGMKPMVLSSKSSKGWKRKCQNIFYEKNSIRREASKKYYYSLSFSYDFTKQNDTVQFAHAVPYTYTRLIQFLKSIQSSKKVFFLFTNHQCIIKSLGSTPLKKSLSIIKFQSQDLRIQKRAIIIMARQHPGQVQGSFAVQQILSFLTKSSTQTQFLLWRFNIYIIPMINVDGVSIGNYRCNALGYDLNRNWQGQQKSKHPQIVYIKNEIKKIMKQYPIQLILDLHGHSNKMNTFFYGNSFGPNPFIYPYIASKTNQYVAFQDCTFTIQTKQKARTARSVLGNLIRQTGNVYTYQMSFYGGQKNGKVINFYQDHFKQLGKDLLISMYKVFVQQYKQQKTLKESLYLKQIRKQIQKIQRQFSNHQGESGSDSQAQQQREQLERQKKQLIQEKIQDMLKLQQNISSYREDQINNLRKSQKIQSSNDLIRLPSFSQKKSIYSYESNSITERLRRDFSLNDQKVNSDIFNYDQSLNQKIKKHKLYSDKLKIYGQNFLTKPQILVKTVNRSQQYNTLELLTQKNLQKSIKVSSMFQDRCRQASQNISQVHYVNKKYRNRSNNFSTISPSKQQWKQEQDLIKDIVRVNRLQYKKIERQKDKFKLKGSINMSNSRKNGIFKLPSILNDSKY